MPLTHILWDNDGVLVDTEKLYFEACRLCLASLGVELTTASFAEHNLTRGLSVFEIAVEQGKLDRAQVPLEVQRRDDLYAELLEAGPCLMPEAEAVVERLAGHFAMGVVTSAKRRHFVLTHRGTRLGSWLDFDYAREDYVRSKPHPDPYLAALRGQALDPERCLVVEDTPRGLAAARAAGLRCVVVPNPMAKDADWSAAEAVLARLADLPDWLHA